MVNAEIRELRRRSVFAKANPRVPGLPGNRAPMEMKMAKAPAKPQKTETAFTLPQLDVQLMEVTLIGDEPLIVHAWSLKAKRMMFDKQTKAATAGREAKNPLADFESSLYRFPDGGYGFPSVAFKAACVTACTSIADITKVAARQAFHVMGEGVDISGAFEGLKMRANLARINAKPHMREDMVRVGMEKADLRYRGEFWPWHCKVLVKWNARLLSAPQIMNLFNTAGFAVGVGEWRAEKDGMNGLFHVATEADMRALEAPKKRRAA